MGLCILEFTKLQMVAEHLSKDLNILFNDAVSQVRYGGHDVEARTVKGRTYRADAVIFTPSLGVLKAKHRTCNYLS